MEKRDVGYVKALNESQRRLRLREEPGREGVFAGKGENEWLGKVLIWWDLVEGVMETEMHRLRDVEYRCAVCWEWEAGEVWSEEFICRKHRS